MFEGLPSAQRDAYVGLPIHSIIRVEKRVARCIDLLDVRLTKLL